MMIDDRYYHLTQMSNIGVIPFPLSTLTKLTQTIAFIQLHHDEINNSYQDNYIRLCLKHPFVCFETW